MERNFCDGIAKHGIHSLTTLIQRVGVGARARSSRRGLLSSPDASWSPGVVVKLIIRSGSATSGTDFRWARVAFFLFSCWRNSFSVRYIPGTCIYSFSCQCMHGTGTGIANPFPVPCGYHCISIVYSIGNSIIPLFHSTIPRQ